MTQKNKTAIDAVKPFTDAVQRTMLSDDAFLRDIFRSTAFIIGQDSGSIDPAVERSLNDAASSTDPIIRQAATNSLKALGLPEFGPKLRRIPVRTRQDIATSLAQAALSHRHPARWKRIFMEWSRVVANRPQVAGAPMLGSLEMAMRSDDRDTRLTALETMATIGATRYKTLRGQKTPYAGPFIEIATVALSDSDFHVRQAAFDGLSALQRRGLPANLDGRLFRTFLTLLGHDDGEIRMRALQEVDRNLPDSAAASDLSGALEAMIRRETDPAILGRAVRLSARLERLQKTNSRRGLEPVAAAPVKATVYTLPYPALDQG